MAPAFGIVSEYLRRIDFDRLVKGRYGLRVTTCRPENLSLTAIIVVIAVQGYGIVYFT